MSKSLAQMPNFRIGLATSARDRVAWDLVRKTSQNFPVAYVLVSQKEGETRYGDLMINNVRAAGLPLITFSSMRFKPWLRKPGRWLEKSLGWSFLMAFWRDLHDRQVMKLLPSNEPIVLLGYMWRFSRKMCQKYKMINLHPAMPGGPTGTWQEVIWQLIESEATETGAMMHLVTPQLDKGPPVTYCTFPIKDISNQALWEAVKKGRKDAEWNLFWEIRRCGLQREFLLIVATLKAFSEGKVEIDLGKRQVIDSQGVPISGYNLTEEIEKKLKGGEDASKK